MAKKILFVCGSLNQTTIMYQISLRMQNYNCYFMPYYAGGRNNRLTGDGFLDFTIHRNRYKIQTLNYLLANKVNIDFRGNLFNYEMIYAFNELVNPRNIIGKKFIHL